MDELLEQLERRLAKLDCLAQPTKESILDDARQQCNEEQLEGYLSGPLAFVEAFNRAMGNEFENSCKRWAASPDQAPSPQDGLRSVTQMLICALLRSMVFAFPFTILLTAVDFLWIDPYPKDFLWIEPNTRLAVFYDKFIKWSLIQVFIIFIGAIQGYFKFRILERQIDWLRAAAHHYSRDPFRAVYCLVNHFARFVSPPDDIVYVLEGYARRGCPASYVEVPLSDKLLNYDDSSERSERSFVAQIIIGVGVLFRRQDAFVAGYGRGAVQLISFLYEDFGQPSSVKKPTGLQIGAILLSFFIIAQELTPRTLEFCRRLFPCLRQCMGRPDLRTEDRLFFH